MTNNNYICAATKKRFVSCCLNISNIKQAYAEAQAEKFKSVKCTNYVHDAYSEQSSVFFECEQLN